MAEGDVVLTGGIDFSAAMAELTKTIETAMNNAAKVIETKLGEAFTDIASKMAAAFDKINDDYKKLGASAGTWGKAHESAGARIDDVFAGLDKHVKLLVDRIQTLETSFTALSKSQAARATGGPAPFGALNDALIDAVRYTRELEAAQDEVGLAPAQVNAIKKRLTEATRQGNTIAAVLQSVMRTSIEHERQVTQTTVAESNERRAIAQSEAKLKIVESQLAAQRARDAAKLETAALVAESREQLARTKATAEARLVVMRTLSRSVVMLERALGKAVSATFSTLRSAVGSVGSTMLSHFRRSQTSMTSTVSREIQERKGLFSSWLRHDEMSLRTSVSRQEKIMRGFQMRTSTGVAGAVTGRGIGGGLFAGLAGGAAVIAGLRSGLNEASNVAEQSSRITVVLGDQAQSIIDWADASVQMLAMTKGAAIEAAAGFSGAIKGSGLTEAEAANWGKTLTQLAADMASFNNTSVGDAITALQSGLSGETEPLRRFNIFLTDAEKKTKALEMGLYDGTGTLSQYAKMQATLALVMEQSTDQQGDLARTIDSYSNRLKVNQAALITFWAAVAEPIKKIGTIILGVTLPALQSMTKFVKDEGGPVMHSFRTALIGAGAGLAALIAAKGAIEVIQLLGLAIKATMSPLGALVVAAGAVGAAIALLMENSEGFRQGLELTGRVLSDLMAPAIQFVQDAWQRMLDAFGGAQQLLDRIGTWLGVHIASAAIWLSETITNTVIPAFKALWRFLGQTVWPILENIASAVSDAFVVAFGVVSNVVSAVASVVGPVIADVLGAFKALAGVIGDIFSGARSPLDVIKEGANAAWEGIVDLIGNIGSALGPLVASVGEWLGRIFTGPNLMKVASGALQVIETLGYILGNVASDPRFLAALAGVAAAAAIVVVRFVEGVARGILENVPELAALIGKGLQAAFKLAVANPKIVLAALFALWAGSALFTTAMRAGQQMSGAFSTGFANGMRAGAGQLTNRIPATFSALLGGSPAATARAASQASAAAAKVASAVLTEYRGLNRDLKALGGTMVAFPSGGPTASTIEEQRRRIEALRTTLGNTAADALLMRDRIGRSFGAVGLATQGLSQAFQRDFGAAKRSLRDAGGAMKLALSDMRRDMKESGVGLGSVIGGGIVAGIGSAMSGYMGGQSGSAAGMAMGVGGVISSSLMALAIGGPAGPIMAGVTAAAGGIAMVLGAAGAAAKKAAAEQKEWTDALKNATTTAELFQAVLGQLKSELENEDDDTVALLSTLAEQTGVTMTDIADAAAQGGAALKSELTGMFAPFLNDQGLVDQLETLGYSVDDVISQMSDDKGSEGTAKFANALGRAAAAAGYTSEQADALAEAADFMDDEIGDMQAGEKFRELMDGAFGATDAVEETAVALGWTKTVAEQYGRAVASWSSAYQDASSTAPAAKEAVEAIGEVAAEARSEADRLRESLYRVLYPEATDVDTAYRDALGAIQQQVGATIATIDAEGNPIDKVFQDADLANIGESFSRDVATLIDQAITSGVTSAADIDAYVLQPLRDTIIKNVADPKIRREMLAQLDFSKADLRAAVKPVVSAQQKAEVQTDLEQWFLANGISTSLKLPDNGAELLQTIGKLKPEVVVALKGLEDDPAKQQELADAIIASAQQYLDSDRGAVISVPADLADYADVIRSGADAGEQVATTFAGAITTALQANTEVYDSGRGLGADAANGVNSALGVSGGASSVAVASGQAIASGLAVGMAVKAYLAVVQATQLAQQVRNAIDDAFEISSPSKVMQRAGSFIGEGLALGIEESTRQVVTATEAMTRAAMEPFGRMADQATVTLRPKVIADAFGEAFGASSGKMADVVQGWQEAFDGVRDNWESLVEQLYSAAGAENRSPEQQRLLASGIVTLNAGDAAGRQNRDALRSALRAAADVTMTSLSRGASVDDALTQFAGKIDQIGDLFESLGYARDEIDKLVDQFGYGADDMERYRRRLERERAKQQREQDRAEAERERKRREREDVREQRKAADEARRSAAARQRGRSFVGTAMDNVVGGRFSQGIADAFAAAKAESTDISSIVSSTVSAVVDNLQNQGSQEQRDTRAMAQIASELFGQVIGPSSVLGVGQAGVMAAQADWTLARNAAFDQSQSVVDQVASAREKQAELDRLKKKKASGEKLTAEERDTLRAGLTRAERDVLNENAFSLNLRDVAGAQNAQMLTELAGQAAAVAQQQLAAGIGADTVNAQFQERLTGIVEMLSNMGFNAKDVTSFLESLGYSSEALDAFAAELDAAGSEAGGGGGGGNGGGNGGGGASPELPPPTVITNNVYLPYGDPEAAALAISNRQAQAAL